MSKIKDFRDLDIWKLGKEIVLGVYTTMKTFPKEEMYGLAAQMRRAAISIPSNIAEGFNRFHNKEYRQFLFISLGSCAELETQVEIAFDLRYIDENIKRKLLEQIVYESKMLRNLIKRICTSD